MKWVKASECPMELMPHGKKVSILFKGEPDILICLEEDGVLSWCFWRRGANPKVKPKDWPFVQWLDEKGSDVMGHELSLMLYRAVKKLSKKELFEDDHKFIDQANQIIVKYSNPLDALRSDNAPESPTTADASVLKNALKPFAAMFDELTEQKVRQGGIVFKYDAAEITVHDLLNAKTALAQYSTQSLPESSGSKGGEEKQVTEYLDKLSAELKQRIDVQARNQNLSDALRAYVKAQGKMLHDWAEGDEVVKKTLWKNLHACEDFAREVLEGNPSRPSIDIVDELRKANPYGHINDYNKLWENCCDKLEEIVNNKK